MKAPIGSFRQIKLAAFALALAGLAGTTFAWSQDAPTFPNTPIQHVIVVIQENRTPDNLFGSDLHNNNGRQLQGADLASSGQCKIGSPSTTIALTAEPLESCVDPDHSHAGAWKKMYDTGKMDDACEAKVYWPTYGPPDPNGLSCTQPACVGSTSQPCQYRYADNSTHLIDPYFNIAKNYGFANYMFQTNQGPSFPAHQFLFTGTSAPVAYPINDSSGDYTWFDSENVYPPSGGNITFTGQSGCPAPWEVPNVFTNELDPTGSLSTLPPCYDHPTMSDLLHNAGLTWRWYGNTGPNQITDESSLWNAPNAISHICGTVQVNVQPNPPQPGQAICTGNDWSVQPPQTVANIVTNIGQLFNDLGDNTQGNCNLANVSWVVPDGHWSDHPGALNKTIVDGGPSWVAAIVNGVAGVGNAGPTFKFPTQCSDTINGVKVPYWQDTVVIIVWDDWGGWYDHVLPWNCNGTGFCGGYSNGNGSGKQYVYGFRVPMLVVSAYTPAGYISGSTLTQGENPPYIHDFGSILNFIEWVFSPTKGSFLGGTFGIGDPHDPYADYFAPDGPAACGQSKCPFGLSDFFGNPTSGFFKTQRGFTFIGGTKYTLTDCFIQPTKHQTDGKCFGSFGAMAPDNDDAEVPQ